MSYSERERKAAEKQAKQRYLELRQKEADLMTQLVEARMKELKTILQTGIQRKINSDEIIAKTLGPFIAPPIPVMPSLPSKKLFEAANPEPGLLEKLTGIGKAKRLQAIQESQKDQEQRYQSAVAAFESARETYNSTVRSAQQAKEERNQAIAHFHEQLAAKDAAPVTRYFTTVLEQSSYPTNFPRSNVRCAYNAQAGELVIEFELQTYDNIIPTIKGYKYIKTRDEMQQIAFTQTDERKMKTLYEEVVSSIALRTVHEIFTADQTQAIQLVVFNGMVSSVDKATGKSIRPCVVSVQVSREEFSNLDLMQVNPVACLQHLKAQTSPSYRELVPVKPIIKLVTTDPRFIDEVDMLSTLDTRPNLLEMDPFDFEHLISNLFAQIGLKTNTTRASRDGGVDVVAFDDRPIFGGKVIIQAKRYRHTVEVSAVRDLFGAVHNEGAIKGILVTTSSFGTESRNFAKDKPLELIDGNALLYLLEQHGFKAKIEIPT